MFLVFSLFTLMALPAHLWALSLEEAKDLANQQNSQILAVAQKVNGAKSQELGAWPTVLPNISLQASATRFDSFQNRSLASVFGGDTSLFPDRSYSAKLAVTQPIFNPAVLPAFGAASALSDAMRYQGENIRQMVLLDTVTSYYNVARAIEMDRLASENVGLLNSLVRQIKEMARLGAVTQSDALAVEVRLKEAERAQLESSKGLVLAKMKLNSVLGSPLNTDVTVNAAMSSQIELPSQVDPIVAIDTALKSRLDLKSLRRTKDLMESSVLLAKTGYLPGIYLIGNYGYVGNSGDFIKNENKDWSVTLSGSWNILDGLSTTSKLGVAEANLRDHDQNIKMAEQGVQIEVIDAILSIESARKGLQLAEVASTLSQRNYSEVSQRYKAGGATNTDLLSAQLTASQAKVGMLNAQYDAVVAGYRYQRSIGLIPVPSATAK